MKDPSTKGDSLKDFNTKVARLLKNPTLKNTYNVKFASQSAFHQLYDGYISSGQAGGDSTTRFLQDAHDCIKGLEQVTEEDEFTLEHYGRGKYVPKVTRQIREKIGYVVGATRKGFRYVDRTQRILMEMRNQKKT